jgi:hypothetical protein
MVRHRFFLRCEHWKRGSPISPEDVEHWTQRFHDLWEAENKDLILNCDETAWPVYPGNILTWCDTGESDASIHAEGDDKSAITVMATISARRKKWRLFFVAKGKAECIQRSQVGDVRGHLGTHSESGWMRHEIFAAYLQHLCEQSAERGVNLLNLRSSCFTSHH